MGIGYNLPTVYYDGTKLEISFAVNGNYFYLKTISGISPNVWHSIEVAQEKVGDQYYYSITVDSRNITRDINNDPRVFHQVKVYASDPWYRSQTGYIRNLYIYTKGIYFFVF